MLRVWLVGFFISSSFCLADPLDHLTKTLTEELRNASTAAAKTSDFPHDPTLRSLLREKPRIPEAMLQAIAKGVSGIYPDYQDRSAEDPDSEVVAEKGHEARLLVAEYLASMTLECCSPAIENDLTQALVKILTLEVHEPIRNAVIEGVFKSPHHPLAVSIVTSLGKFPIEGQRDQGLYSPGEIRRARESRNKAVDAMTQPKIASCATKLSLYELWASAHR